MKKVRFVSKNDNEAALTLLDISKSFNSIEGLNTKVDLYFDNSFENLKDKYEMLVKKREYYINGLTNCEVRMNDYIKFNNRLYNTTDPNNQNVIKILETNNKILLILKSEIYFYKMKISSLLNEIVFLEKYICKILS